MTGAKGDSPQPVHGTRDLSDRTSPNTAMSLLHSSPFQNRLLHSLCNTPAVFSRDVGHSGSVLHSSYFRTSPCLVCRLLYTLCTIQSSPGATSGPACSTNHRAGLSPATNHSAPAIPLAGHLFPVRASPFEPFPLTISPSSFHSISHHLTTPTSLTFSESVAQPSSPLSHSLTRPRESVSHTFSPLSPVRL